MRKRTIISGILVASILLAVWVLWRPLQSHRQPTPPSPELTCHQAAQAAAPAVREIHANLRNNTPPQTVGREPGIYLRAGAIHPVSPANQNPPTTAHARPSARGFPWMVLFDGPIQPEWRQALEEAGATIRAYLPRHALLCEVPTAAGNPWAQVPHVLWSGEYLPQYKMQPLLAALARQQPELPVPVTVQTFAPDDAQTLARQMTAAGATDVRAVRARRWGLIRGVLPAANAWTMAQLPEVQWLEYHEPPKLLNDFARGADRLHVDVVHEQHGLDGAGQIVAIADTGLDSGDTNTLHPDLAGQVLQVFDTGRSNDWSDIFYHGTHVAGSLLGTGAASGGQYRGMAPGAKLVMQSVMTASESLNFPDDLYGLYVPAYNADARIHSDSWGSAVNGEYDSDAMTTDEFIWDYPDMLVVYAAGNEGADYNRDGVVDWGNLHSPASAKNVLTIGASESGRPAGSGGRSGQTYGSVWAADFRKPPISTDLISSSPDNGPQGIVGFSSRGPTLDGRNKPDVVAPGSDVISVRSRASEDTGWGVLAANTNYCFMGGTSMATPLASGAATLVRQYCTDVLGMPAPSAALLKAVLTGGARSLTPGQYGAHEFREIPPLPRPNPVEGYGQIDLANTLFPGSPIQAVLVDDSRPLHTGQTNQFDFFVAESAALTVTMAYSDFPAALASAKDLVNDLDLKLLAPNQTPYYPGGRAGPDDFNNVETIDIETAATGRWTLVVSAPNVPADPQPYALYLRGAVRMPVFIQHEPLPNTWDTNTAYEVVAQLSSALDMDPESVVLHWNLTGNPEGFTDVPMTATNGVDFIAHIPAQDLNTTIYYYLSAGHPDLLATHPTEAPAQLHSFRVVPPRTLTISGSPSNLLASEPAYGVHILPSDSAVHAQAQYSHMGTNGQRTACVGWIGAGSVPPGGEQDFCDFILTEDSSITWLWQEQVALTQTSSPAGALNAVTWHEKNSTATSWMAPESHRFNGVALTFAGWQVDGSRWPASPAPSRHQISGIPMPTTRTAVATFVATDRDDDANHLPDWFELRYFGSLGQNRYADPDGDGFENELEASDHTDPLDPLSTPAPPVIQHVPLPANMTSPAPWQVAATITDNDRVASATLSWQRNGGMLRSIAMSNAAPNYYTASIPSPVRDGDQVVYSLSAVDTAGFSAQAGAWTVSVAYARMGELPASLLVTAPANTQTNWVLECQNNGSQPLDIHLAIGPVGFWDDAESGTNGWTRPDGYPDWHLTQTDAHSPSHSWYCGQEPTLLYRNSIHASLVSPPIQVGALAPRLDFMHWARFEIDQDEITDGVHYWDSGVLEITDNGGLTWQALPPEGGFPGLITSNSASPFAPETPCLASTSGWEPVSADLSAYSNRVVQLRFRFGSDMYVNDEGWRVDDIEVSPRTQFGGWLTFSETNFIVAAATSHAFVLQFNTCALPPMATDSLALQIFHNDPEKLSPLVIPLTLQNTTRRIRIETSGQGAATPDGEILLPEDAPFAVELTAADEWFIADIRTNNTPIPLPDIISTQTLEWTALEDNLAIQAIFAPRLPDEAVPSQWLENFGLTNRNWMAEASLDQDKDGLLTWQEYELGSSPVNAEDAPLRVQLLPPNAPQTNWHLTWHAFTNAAATYSILSTPDMLTDFSAFTNVPAAPPVMTSPPLPPDHFFFGIRKQ